MDVGKAMENEKTCPRCGIPINKHCDELSEMRKVVERLIDVVADNKIKHDKELQNAKKHISSLEKDKKKWIQVAVRFQKQLETTTTFVVPTIERIKP
jgi:hypothetical protein